MLDTNPHCVVIPRTIYGVIGMSTEARDEKKAEKKGWVRAVQWIAILGGLFVSWLIGNDWLRPVGPLKTAGHALHENACAKCHIGSKFLRVRRLVVDITPNSKCLGCHDETLVHNANQEKEYRRCVQCHDEHGDELIVGDKLCFECHRQLKTKNGPSERFANVNSWAEHPEIRLLRGEPARKKTSLSPAAQMLAELLGQTWKDNTALEFSHRVHLTSDKVRISTAGLKRALTCNDCHEKETDDDDVARVEWKPIAYTQHCESCHSGELRLSLPALGTKDNGDRAQDTPDRARLIEARQAGDKVTLEIPHVHPNVVQPTVEKQLRNYFEQQFGEKIESPESANIPGETKQQEDRSKLFPGERPQQQPNPKLNVEEWLAEQRKIADRSLFPDNVRDGRQGTGCAYCHIVHNDGKGSVQIEKPYLPKRWLIHSKFSHNDHARTKCDVCHAKADSSRETADILLPSIKTCQECHGRDGAQSAARGDCIECHVYHRHSLNAPNVDVP